MYVLGLPNYLNGGYKTYFIICGKKFRSSEKFLIPRLAILPWAVVLKGQGGSHCACYELESEKAEQK